MFIITARVARQNGHSAIFKFQLQMKLVSTYVILQIKSNIQGKIKNPELTIHELNAEIRKLKAMIVKHESRIRTLETKNRELEQSHNNGGGHITHDDMDPDEV